MAFQFAHFGDDSRPEKWFVTPEAALNFEPEYEDILGYYDDGVKRTLTDEQIADFRQTELWHLRADEEDEDIPNGATSPRSEVSSLEEELMSQAVRDKMQRPPNIQQSQNMQQPHDTHQSHTMPQAHDIPEPHSIQQPQSQATTLLHRESSQTRSDSATSDKSIKRRRSQEVPYDERRKRHWESYIEENDPVEGSLTHRRMARELDNQKEEAFDMDY